MILHEMLANTSFYGQVLIYARNAYDQCVKLFREVLPMPEKTKMCGII